VSGIFVAGSPPASQYTERQRYQKSGNSNCAQYIRVGEAVASNKYTAHRKEKLIPLKLK
jgi:hypothetical protein